jgi:hypothetical protein
MDEWLLLLLLLLLPPLLLLLLLPPPPPPLLLLLLRILYTLILTHTLTPYRHPRHRLQSIRARSGGVHITTPRVNEREAQFSQLPWEGTDCGDHRAGGLTCCARTLSGRSPLLCGDHRAGGLSCCAGMTDTADAPAIKALFERQLRARSNNTLHMCPSRVC